MIIHLINPLADFLLCLLSFVLWWVLYDLVLTPQHQATRSLFGKRPNVAVALDLLGGLMAIGLFMVGLLVAQYGLPLWYKAVYMLFMVLALGFTRKILGALVGVVFGRVRDSHGAIINIDHELFKQRNIAGGVLMLVLYVWVAIALGQYLVTDFGDTEAVLASTLVAASTLVMCMIICWVHSVFFLGRSVLGEIFKHNNLAAAFSLMGLSSASQLIMIYVYLGVGYYGAFLSDEYLKHGRYLWIFFGIVVASAIVLRLVLFLLLRILLGLNIYKALTVDRSIVWGLFDGVSSFVWQMVFVLAFAITWYW